MDKKKLLIIGSIVAIILSLSLVIYKIATKEKEPEFIIEGIIAPTNKEILQDAKVEELEIKNVSILTRNNISSYKATVYNPTDKDIKIEKLYVVFYEGDKTSKAITLYKTTLKSKAETYIDITSEKDLTNTTKIEYKIEN